MGLALPAFLLPDEIHVRVISLAEAEEFLAAVHESVDAVGKWLPWCTSDYSLAMAEEWIHFCRTSFQQGEMYEFGIFQGGRFVGGLGLNQIDRQNLGANLGYWVRTSAHGRGIMTQAARRVAEWGLTEAGLKRVGIIAAVGNVASRRVAGNIGATYEGTLRSRILLHGEMHDAAQYSLIASDLHKNK